jgi:virginiamycin A acetyltransferase
MIEIAPSAKVSAYSDIEDSVRGTKIIIGEGAVIDSFVKIKPVGGCGDVVIGANSIINSNCVIYSGNGVNIGCNVAVAAGCTFAATNHEYKDANALIMTQGFRPSKGGILIEDDVWIGAGTILLDGAILRRGCVIGAMSLVRQEVPEFSVYSGNPLTRTGMRR